MNRYVQCNHLNTKDNLSTITFQESKRRLTK
nr:MAG TPA: hypothetical protein [Caudoviricetes sp.]